MSQGRYEFGNGQRGSGIPMRLILAVILALVSIIGYYSKSVVNPVTGKKQHISMSVNDEIQLGLQASPRDGSPIRRRSAQYSPARSRARSGKSHRPYVRRRADAV